MHHHLIYSNTPTSSSQLSLGYFLASYFNISCISLCNSTSSMLSSALPSALSQIPASTPISSYGGIFYGLQHSEGIQIHDGVATMCSHICHLCLRGGKRAYRLPVQMFGIYSKQSPGFFSHRHLPSCLH